MNRIARIGVVAIAMLSPPSASGARYPNATEATIVATGPAAREVAELLGLSGAEPASLSLRLGPGEAWAVYLLKQDTKEPLDNDNNGSPARYNVVDYAAIPVPTLQLSPYWLDLATRLPEPLVGQYAFGSPTIPEKPDPADPWTRIFQRLAQEPGWDNKAWPQFRRCFTSSENIELCVEAYGIKDYTDNIERDGHIVRIVAHPKDGRTPKG